MENTSLGYHTLSIHLKMNYEYFSHIEGDFIKYANDPKNGMKRFPMDIKGRRLGWCYIYNNDKGLQWRLYSFESENGYENHSITAIINPRVLLYNNYIYAAQADDIRCVREIFNRKIQEISAGMFKFDDWSMNRADYCLNIDTEELGLPCTAKQLMKLVKRANIPKHFTERKEYDPTSHRLRSDPNSFYLESKSVTINFYRKYFQQNPKHPNYANRDASFNVIRFEIQCKYPKLYALSRSHKLNGYDCLDSSDEALEEMYYDYIETGIFPPKIKPDSILTDTISHKILETYIYKIIRKGDYFTLDGAKEIVESYNFRLEKEERLLYALDIVSESRGIAAAKQKLSGLELDDFKRSLNDLDEILVNPVTIPRKWNTPHIFNPLRAYTNRLFEEQLISYSEFCAYKHIQNILEK